MGGKHITRDMSFAGGGKHITVMAVPQIMFVVAAAMTEARTTQSGTSLKLVFNPTKRQLKLNGNLTSLKDFWITNLEGGNINSLLFRFYRSA